MSTDLEWKEYTGVIQSRNLSVGINTKGDIAILIEMPCGDHAVAFTFDTPSDAVIFADQIKDMAGDVGGRVIPAAHPVVQ